MTPLPDLAVHKISGADAGSFLHAQLAADTAALADGQACFAAYCSPRGQVIALLLVCRRGSDWFIATHGSLAGQVAARLERYVLRAKVQIREQPDLQVAGVASTPAGAAERSLFKPGNLDLTYALVPAGAPDPAAVREWRHREILRYVVWLQSATSERFLPQMLGLDAIGAVSFSKGCYPGQEIIARARYLGKLKRRPVLVDIEGNASAGAGEPCAVISAGERIEGVIADSVCADGRSSTALVVAPLEAGGPVSFFESLGERFPARRIQAQMTG